MTASLDPMPRSQGKTLESLVRDVAGARDPQILRIVATVEAMTSRGEADALIAPLRRRLRTLRPSRPLRFARLLFHPLDPLIVPRAGARPSQNRLPRTVLLPIAEHVRLKMGAAGEAIEAAIMGKKDGDAALIARLGKAFWPAAAAVLAEAEVPAGWTRTGLLAALYPPLANTIAALLRQAPALDALCAATANGLLPPDTEMVRTMLSSTAAADTAALPMLVTLLLDRLPATATVIADMVPVPDAPTADVATMRAVLDAATDQLLFHLDHESGIGARIGAGSLADAGAATAQLIALVRQFDTGDVPRRRRKQLNALRQRIDGDCRVRFASGLQEEVLEPLRQLAAPSASAAIDAIEAAARGLRVLEIEARSVGGGPTYDLLLGTAVDAIKDDGMRDRLTAADQARLLEILAGPDAAMALLVRDQVEDRRPTGGF